MKRTPERVESGDFPRSWTEEMIEYCHHIIAFRCNEESRKGIKPVRCIETGEIFGTAAEAARSMGLCSTAVCKSIRAGERSGGYHWEYIQKQNK